MFQLLSVRFMRYPPSIGLTNHTVKHVPPLLLRQIRGMMTAAPATTRATTTRSVETFMLCGWNNFILPPPRLQTTSRSFATDAAAAAASSSAEEGRGITVARSKGKQTGYCYGCGADLVKGTAGTMSTAPKKTGYWAEKSQTLKISKIKNWALCPRCKKLNQAAKKSGGGAAIEDMVDILGPDHAMTEVFRKEVGKIRAKQNIVIVLCVDAVNVSGTLIRTIRNYIGGNPILLAVTRCDLLPDYIWDEKGVPELKEVFAERAKEIQPAALYLCTEEKEHKERIPGFKELAKDLWKHLNERDVYVVGAANIGKSTLTDALIRFFIRRGEKEERFFDRLSKKRVEKLREARVTKSALPGTTLQNIRVPCFEDHTQALWDTPGLLLDASLAHFPIRDFKRIRASRPTKINATILEVPEKSFALLICEKGDETPLVRVEVRLNKNAEGEGPMRLVWNSTLPLHTKIVDIESACKEEKERVMQLEKMQEEKERVMQLEKMQVEKTPQRNPEYTPEERAARKAERRRLYEERVKKEQEELGKKEWKAQQAEKRAKEFEVSRAKKLAKLSEVDQVIIDRGVGMDLEIENFGWIGILPPRTAMVTTFAPSTGVRVVHTSPLALPTDWGEYETLAMREAKASKKPQKEDIDDEDEDLFEQGWDEEIEDDYDFLGDGLDYDGYDELEYSDEDEGEHHYNKRGRARPPDRHLQTKKYDPWEKFSGEHVGWQFDADTRWSKGKKFEGWNPMRKDE